MYINDTNLDDEGNPYIVYITSHNWAAGPGGDPRTWRLARWDGQEWIHTVITTSTHNYDVGSIYIEGDTLRVIGPTGTGPQEYGTGGEVGMWISRDKGATWSKVRDVTAGSEYNHSYIRRPRNARDPFYGYWADGHAMTKTDSRLYFCNRAGTRVWRLTVRERTIRKEPPMNADERGYKSQMEQARGNKTGRGFAFLPCAFLLFTSSAASAAPPGPPGDGVAFDGRTAYAVPIEALNLDPSAITVSAWVMLTGSTAPQMFINSGHSNSGFNLYLYNNQVRMLVGHRGTVYAHATAPPPAADTWVHYAGTYDGKVIKAYMNGELTKSTDAPGRIRGLGENIIIGALDAHERFLSGRLEDVRIWRRALSPEEVAAVAAGRGSLEDGLAAAWTSAGLAADIWKAQNPGAPAASRIEFAEPRLLINERDEGYRGIWYMNQPSGDEYVYKYSGGLGTYCANHIPHAWYVKEAEKTFFTYGGTTTDSNTRLIHMVSYFDHKTGMVPRPTILLDKKTSDAHDNPVINVDDKGYIWIFSSSHGTARPSYISRSRKPHAIDEFELVWTGNFSYPQPWHIPGQGFLFMHTYYDKGRTVCMMTLDTPPRASPAPLAAETRSVGGESRVTSPDGVNWTERRLLSRIHQGHYASSRPLAGGKVGTFFNHHPDGKGLNWRTNVYYMETRDFGKTWQAADGTILDIPLTQIENPALVHDYESEQLLMYTQDLTCDAKGNPILMYVTSKGYESGPKNMPRTWTIARWTGSAWDIQGRDIVSDNNYDLGSLYIEADDTWRIIGPTEPGPQTYNPGGEIAMWVSRDQGRNWSKVRQMTRDSEYNHTFVRRPVNAHPDFYGFWADGHGRQPSDSRLYFCNRDGDVFRLPVKMDEDSARPARVTDFGAPGDP